MSGWLSATGGVGDVLRPSLGPVLLTEEVWWQGVREVGEEREKREAKGASEHTERARSQGRGQAGRGCWPRCSGHAPLSVDLHPLVCWGGGVGWGVRGAHRTSGKRRIRLGEGTGTK